MNPVTITPKALSHIKTILESKNVPADYGLRLIVQGGTGCGGVNFRLGFDKKKETDEVYYIEDLEILYQKKDMLFLIGMEIDFEEQVTQQGFVFNPKPIL